MSVEKAAMSVAETRNATQTAHRKTFSTFSRTG